jgi:benzoylformate decarboxylase
VTASSLTVRQATHDLMRALGMTTVFGNPGSTELRFFRETPSDFRYVLALQESSAVAMADGYAQATGRPAFVNLHSAVGVGHALGSIFTAMRNRAPLVITAGQQTRALLPTEPFLFAEQATEFPRPYVKWSSEPARAQDVPAAIARAYYTAAQRPYGPTFVSIPEDDWEATAEPVTPRAIVGDFVGDVGGLQAVAAALDRSARPALVVGPGVDRDGAWNVTVDLAERAGAAVWVSPLSSRCSFPEDHPAFSGFLTPDRQKLRQQLAGYDVIVVLGAPVFTYHVPSDGPFLPEGATLFQLVDDPAAASFAPVGTAVLTSLGPGVAEIVKTLVGPARPSAAGRGARPVPPASDPPSGGYVMHAVDELLSPGAIVVEEAPSHRNALHEHLMIRRPGGFYAGASGGLGYALPAAVGVGLASPGERVVCLLGDGSSLYSFQALWTAVQWDLPISVVIFDNRGYSALKAFGRAMAIDQLPGLDLPGIDFLELAAGFGCAARRVETAAELETALRWSFAATGPTLVDVAVDDAIERLY